MIARYIILFRSVPLSIVTHTGIYKQRNGTEQEFHYIKILQSTEKWLIGCVSTIFSEWRWYLVHEANISTHAVKPPPPPPLP